MKHSKECKTNLNTRTGETQKRAEERLEEKRRKEGSFDVRKDRQGRGHSRIGDVRPMASQGAESAGR